MKGYRDSIAWLDDFSNYEKNSHRLKPLFSLKGIKELSARLGNPQRSFPAVHVAGTVGKGSVCEIISEVLMEAGCCVGLYTSPHLVDIRERIRINGKMISRRHFTETVNELKKKVNSHEIADFTYFEVLTAIAVRHFEKRKVDIAVVETGLGGRLDATRIVKPALSIITAIGMDHTHVLGETLGEIAREKAGIIPRNGNVVVASQRPAAMKVLRETCKKRGAKLIDADKTHILSHNSVENEIFIEPVFLGEARQIRLFLPLAGRFQLENARTAVAALGFLDKNGFRITGEQLTEGFGKVRLRGRVEIHHLENNGKTKLIIDGAHNPPAASALAEALREIPHHRLVLLLGMMKDKDLSSVVQILAPAADEVVPMSLPGDRAFLAKDINKAVSKHSKVKFCANSTAEALDYAVASAKSGTLICLTGSLYAVGEGLKWLKKQKPTH